MMKTALLLLFLCSISAFGQDDAGMMAAQQASQQAMQAGYQAGQQMQQNMLQAQQISQQMIQNMVDVSLSSSSSGPIIGAAIQPTFTVKQGKVAAGTQVRIHSATHYAVIYYTTDGWTPTRNTIRYTGPITINADTHLQAIALGPNLLHSSIARADYTVDAPATTPVLQTALMTNGILHAGTTLHLVVNSKISSQTAEVGDKVPLLLDQQIKVGDTVIIPKGTPVDAILTVADPAGKRNAPGDLVFEVHSLNVQGRQIPLSGGETLEEQAGRNPKEAVIEPGMVVTAVVSVDTPLKP
jgi:hypothetical protein